MAQETASEFSRSRGTLGFAASVFVEAHRLLRDVAAKALDASLAQDAGEGLGVVTIERYIRYSLKRLTAIWPADADKSTLVALAGTLNTGDSKRTPSFHYLAEQALEAAGILDEYFASAQVVDANGIRSALELLEPEIVSSSLLQLEQGLYRDAVLNAFVAVFDLLRSRTGLDADGAALVTRALSLDGPKLAIGDLCTSSGQNEQKGFIQLLQGAYLAIRNPAAHTLAHDLDDREARQCLVVASFLARRIREARKV